jgi:hypothetical protein
MSEHEGAEGQRDAAADEQTEPLPSPDPGYPAGETKPYGGDVSHEQGTPPIGGEEQDDERTTEPSAGDDPGVPPLDERP